MSSLASNRLSHGEQQSFHFLEWLQVTVHGRAGGRHWEHKEVALMLLAPKRTVTVVQRGDLTCRSGRRNCERRAVSSGGCASAFDSPSVYVSEA